MFLLYNRVNQLQVLTDIYPLPLVLPPPPHPTHLGHHRASGWAPQAVQQVPRAGIETCTQGGEREGAVNWESRFDIDIPPCIPWRVDSGLSLSVDTPCCCLSSSSWETVFYHVVASGVNTSRNDEVCLGVACMECIRILSISSVITKAKLRYIEGLLWCVPLLISPHLPFALLILQSYLQSF